MKAASSEWFDNGILWEPACERYQGCNTDQLCFKGFLAQYMGLATIMAPGIADEIFPLLASSAVAAGTHCESGSTGTMCSPYWTKDFDHAFTPTVGAQMTALNLFNANMINPRLSRIDGTVIVTNTTGGTSPGNPQAGPNSETTLG